MHFIVLDGAGNLVSLGRSAQLPDGAIEVTPLEYTGLQDGTLIVVDGEVVSA